MPGIHVLFSIRFVYKDVDGRDKPGHDEMREQMISAIKRLKPTGVAFVFAMAVLQAAHAEDGFPFGLEMTLDVARQPGSKRLPNLEIGDNGEVVLELWCKGGKGQFSVAGNTVVFVAAPLEDRACPPARAQADDDLVAALSEAATWKRQGDVVSFVGTRSLRFRINTN
jgi:heat shock protein HslJ